MENRMPNKLVGVKIGGTVIVYESVDAIPDEHSGEIVGVYHLTHTRTLRVEKTLSLKKEA